MVAGEKMDFDTFPGKFLKGCQNWDIGIEHDILVTVPEIKEITQDKEIVKIIGELLQESK